MIDKIDFVSARLAAQEIALCMDRAYWLNNGREAYHIEAAKEQFAKLTALMAKLDALEQPREVSNATQAKKDQVA